jgi:hypothetical protein
VRAESSPKTLSLAAIARSYLKSRGLEVNLFDEGSRLVFSFPDGDGESRDGQLVVYEDSRVVRLFVSIPQLYAPLRREWVQRLVAVANEELSIFGFFVLSTTLGLYYHVACPIPDNDTLPLDTLEALIDRTTFPRRTFEQALGRITRINVSPTDAMEAALIECEAKEIVCASRVVKKALFTVVK